MSDWFKELFIDEAKVALSSRSGSVESLNTLRYDQQILTEEQKAQARENIGATTEKDILEALPMGEGVRF